MGSARTVRVTGTISWIVAFRTMDRDAIGVYSNDSSLEDRGDRIAMRLGGGISPAAASCLPGRVWSAPRGSSMHSQQLTEVM